MGKTGDLKKTRRFRSTAPKLPSATTLEEPRSRGQRKRALKKVARVSKLGLVLRKQQYDGICEVRNLICRIHLLCGRVFCSFGV